MSNPNIGSATVSFGGDIQEFIKLQKQFMLLMGMMAKDTEKSAKAIEDALNSMLEKMDEMGARAQTDATKAVAAGTLLANAMKWVAKEVANTTKAIVTWGLEAVKTAARVQQLVANAQFLGARMGQGVTAVTAMITQIRDMGTTTETAAGLVANLARYNIDLSKAVDLARVALDLSAISGLKVTDVFERFTHGIVTLQSRTLRYIGLHVNLIKAKQDLAHALDKEIDRLSTEEQEMAMINAILTEGEKIRGLFVEDLKYAGMQAQMLSRDIGLLGERAGDFFVGAYGKAVVGLRKFIDTLYDSIAPGTKMSASLQQLGDALEKLFERFAALAAGALPGFIDWLALTIRSVMTLDDGIKHLAGHLASLMPNLAELGKFIISRGPQFAAIGALAGWALGVGNPLFIPIGAAVGAAASVAVGSILQIPKVFADAVDRVATEYENTLNRIASINRAYSQIVFTPENLIGTDVFTQANLMADAYIEQLRQAGLLESTLALRRGETAARPLGYRVAGVKGFEAQVEVLRLEKLKQILPEVSDGMNRVSDSILSMHEGLTTLRDPIVIAANELRRLGVISKTTYDQMLTGMAKWTEWTAETTKLFTTPVYEYLKTRQEQARDYYDQLRQADYEFRLESRQAELDYAATMAEYIARADTDNIAKVQTRYKQEKEERDRAYGIELTDLKRKNWEVEKENQRAFGNQLQELAYNMMVLLGVESTTMKTVLDMIAAHTGATIGPILLWLDDLKKELDAVGASGELNAQKLDAAFRKVWDAMTGAPAGAGGGQGGPIPLPPQTGVSQAATDLGKETRERATETLANVMEEISRGVTAAFDAFYQVLGYKSPAFERHFLELMDDVRWAVQIMYQNFELLGKDIVEKAGSFAENANSVVGSISSAIDAFDKLSSYRVSVETVAKKLAILRLQIVEAINTMIWAGWDFSTGARGEGWEETPAAAARMAGWVETVMGAISSSVEALDALAKYRARPLLHLDEFFQSLTDTVNLMTEFDATNLFTAAANAKALESVTSWLGEAVQAVGDMATMSLPYTERIVAFFDLFGVILTQITEWTMPTDVEMLRIKTFTDFASNVASWLSDATEGLTKIATLPLPDSVRLTAWFEAWKALMLGLRPWEGHAGEPVWEPIWDIPEGAEGLIQPYLEFSANVASWLADAATGLSKIKGLVFPDMAQVEAFAISWQAFIWNITKYAGFEYDYETMRQTLDAYVKFSAEVAGLVVTISEALAAIRLYRAIPDVARKVLDFMTDLGALIKGMQEQLNILKWTPESAAIMESFATTVGTLFDGLTSVMDFLTKLRQFQPVEDLFQSCYDFFTEMSVILTSIQRMTPTPELEQVAETAKLIGEVFSGLANTFDLLESMAKYAPVPDFYLRVQVFMSDLNELLSALEDSATIWGAYGLDVAAKWGEAVGTLVGGVVGAFDIFDKLRTYTKMPNIRQFKTDLETLLRTLDTMAQSFGDEGLDVAAAWGENVGKTVDGMLKALDLLVGLANYRLLNKRIMDSFFYDIKAMINQWQDLTALFDITNFADEFTKSVDAMTSALGHMLVLLRDIGLTDFSDVSSNMTYFLTLMRELLLAYSEMSGNATGTPIPLGEGFPQMDTGGLVSKRGLYWLAPGELVLSGANAAGGGANINVNIINPVVRNAGDLAAIKRQAGQGAKEAMRQFVDVTDQELARRASRDKRFGLRQ